MCLPSPHLRNYVRNQERLSTQNLILESKFTLFQPRNLDLIAAPRQHQRHDLRIEIAMVSPQDVQMFTRILLIHLRMLARRGVRLNARNRLVACATGFIEMKGDKSDQK